MKLDDYSYQHLTIRTLKNKEDVVDVSKDIENSFTGRLDVMGLHIFFLEASSLLRNAVKQYEQGFFDSAFYSVRSALELARVIAYFSNQDQPLESDIYKKWVQGGKFPYDSQIRGDLKDTSVVYSEIREALPEFFNAQEQRLKQSQKYIHKQGYKTFYNQNTFRSDLEGSRIHKIDELFTDFITNSTAEIALLRLCIDPFPILLQDEAIMYKIHHQSMTDPYHDKTIKLIGKENIAKYCSTDFYRSHVDFFSKNEELDESAYSLINHQFYNKDLQEKLKKQFHLLSKDNILAVKIFDVSDDIAKIYLHGGLTWYFTNTTSVRKNLGFNSANLQRLVNSDSKVNTKYDGALLSYFTYNKSDCWVEHNSKLNKQQIGLIEKVLGETNEN